MAKLILSIFSLTILLLTYTAVASLDLVEVSCKETTHPAECSAMLMPQAMEIGGNRMKLAKAALSISITVNNEMNKFLNQEVAKPSVGKKEQAALKQCLEVSRDVLELLNRSMEEMKKLPKALQMRFIEHKNNIQTWVSSSLSDYTTCVDGFSEMEGGDEALKTSVTIKMSDAERDTSIALALINQLTK